MEAKEYGNVGKKAIWFVKSLLCGYIVTGFLLLILALMLYKLGLSEQNVNAGIVLIYVIPFILENYFQILLKELMKFEKNIVKLMLNAKILLIYLFQIIHLELKALYTEIKLPIF